MKLRLAPEKLKAILIMAGILASLALPLMFLLEDFVRDAIIVPLGYYAWFFGVILDALPQSWIVTAVLIFLVHRAIKSLGRKRAPVRKSSSGERQLSGNVQSWTERINLVSQGTYSRERFQHQFGQVLMRWVSHEERLSVRETVRLIQTQELNVEPEMLPYLQRVVGDRSTVKYGFIHWLRALLTRKPKREETLKKVAREIEPALHSLERQLRLIEGEEADE